MLEQLTIKNLVLIEALTINFEEGFSVITGETGAGKSIIIGAIGILLGDKADASVVRPGASEALVSALFSLPPGHPIEQVLARKGIEVEDGTLLLNRIVRANGRSTITLQGQPATRAELSQIGALLVDLHGQHEHQSLLSNDRQRRVLDGFGQLDEEREHFAKIYQNYLQAQRTLEALHATLTHARHEEDYLKFALSELESAKIQPGEDEELQDKLRLLSHAESIHEHLEAAREALGGFAGTSALSLLAQCENATNKAATLDSTLISLAERLESLRIEAQDIDESLREHLQGTSYSQFEIDEMQSRLALIQRLKRKYGPNLPQLFAFYEETKTALNNLDQNETLVAQQEKEVATLKKEAERLAQHLTERRLTVAKQLEQEIRDKLIPLGMPKVQFVIAIEKKEWSSHGQDRIEFLFSANVGLPLGALRTIASGGELSRVMLAIKSVLAANDEVQTLIFDEVDAGIGGTVAIAVGEQLAALAESRQVFAITHLASIAAQADHHYIVQKESRDAFTYTTICAIEAEERFSEIARMLSGDSFDDIALEHARHLLEHR